MHFSEGRVLLDLIRIFPLVNNEAKVKARGWRTNENKTVIQINNNSSNNNNNNKTEGGKIYLQGKMKKKKEEMGFARREAEIKHKAQENEYNKKQNKKRTHSSEKKSL